MSQEKKSAGQRFIEQQAAQQTAKAAPKAAAVPRKKIQINPSVAAHFTGGNQAAAKSAPVRGQPPVGKLGAHALAHMNFLGANHSENSAEANQPGAAAVVQELDANRGAALAALFGGGAAPAPVVSAPVAPAAPAVIDPNAPPPPPPPAVGAPIVLAAKKPTAAASAPAPGKKKWDTVIPAARGVLDIPQQPVVQSALQVPAAPVQQPLQVLPVAPVVQQVKPTMAEAAAQRLKGHAHVHVFAAPTKQSAVAPQQPLVEIPVGQAQPSTPLLANSTVASPSFFAAAPAAPKTVIVREKKNFMMLLKEFENYATLQAGNPSPEDICDFLNFVKENPVKCHLRSGHKITHEANILRAASNQVVLCDELAKVVTEIMDPKWNKAGWSKLPFAGKRPDTIRIAQEEISKMGNLLIASTDKKTYLVNDAEPDAIMKAFTVAYTLRQNFHEFKSSSKQKDYERWHSALDAALLNFKAPISDNDFEAAIQKMMPNQLTK